MLVERIKTRKLVEITYCLSGNYFLFKRQNYEKGKMGKNKIGEKTKRWMRVTIRN